LQSDPDSPKTLETLRTLATAAALRLIRRGRLPLRTAGQQWEEQDADELVAEAWMSGRLRSALERATNDRQLKAYVAGTLQQQAIVMLRKSGAAALYYRVTGVLKEGPFVGHPDDHWFTIYVELGRYTGSNADLVAAAFRVPIKVLPQKEDARTTSFASREHLETLITAILERAGLPVLDNQIVEVVGERVGYPVVRGLDTIDDYDPVAPEPADGTDTTDEITAILELGDERVEAILELLTEEERGALPYIELSDVKLGARIGRGKTYANTLRARIRTKLIAAGHGSWMLRSSGVETP
jgi:DNA-directed RNA polymerase specialized sigma24 family protein